MADTSGLVHFDGDGCAPSFAREVDAITFVGNDAVNEMSPMDFTFCEEQVLEKPEGWYVGLEFMAIDTTNLALGTLRSSNLDTAAPVAKASEGVCRFFEASTQTDPAGGDPSKAGVSTVVMSGNVDGQANDTTTDMLTSPPGDIESEMDTSRGDDAVSRKPTENAATPNQAAMTIALKDLTARTRKQLHALADMHGVNVKKKDKKNVIIAKLRANFTKGTSRRTATLWTLRRQRRLVCVSMCEYV